MGQRFSKNNMKKKDILIIIILLFVFVVAWVGFSIYHSVISSTISETTSQDISPIAPTFDTKTIEKLKLRQKITPSFELKSITPTPFQTLPAQLAPPKASGEGKLAI